MRELRPHERRAFGNGAVVRSDAALALSVHIVAVANSLESELAVCFKEGDKDERARRALASVAAAVAVVLEDAAALWAEVSSSGLGSGGLEVGGAAAAAGARARVQVARGQAGLVPPRCPRGSRERRGRRRWREATLQHREAAAAAAAAAPRAGWPATACGRARAAPTRSGLGRAPGSRGGGGGSR
jgi:hypothetical protein